MKFLNIEHKKLFEELFADNQITFDKSIEAISEKEAIEVLLRKTGREGIENLIKYLNKKDYYTAPASTKFHGNYAGGLAEHSLNVCAILNRENKVNNGGLRNDTVIISALMHDLCKVDFYVTEMKNVKTYLTDENRDKYRGCRIQSERVNGIERTFVWVPTEVYKAEDKFPLLHGPKSLYLLQKCMQVTDEEALLISWHMGPFANLTNDNYGFNTAVDFQPSVALMYVADFLASSLYEITKK